MPTARPVFAALPAGLEGLDAELVTVTQRGRLLDAIAAVVAERGYAAATIGDVVGRAGMSRKTFYEHFSDKEDCFLAAHALGVRLVSARIAEAVAGVEAPADRVRAGLAAYLETLAGAPAFARTFEVEVLAAGERALAQREQAQDAFAAMLPRASRDRRADRMLRRAVVAAVADMVAVEVRRRRTPDLRGLAAPATRAALRLLGLDDS